MTQSEGYVDLPHGAKNVRVTHHDGVSVAHIAGCDADHVEVAVGVDPRTGETLRRQRCQRCGCTAVDVIAATEGAS